MVNYAIRLAIVVCSVLLLGACTTRQDAEGFASSMWSKDQHQVANICISAKHAEDVSEFQGILKDAGFKGVEECSDEVESDAVLSITRWKYPNGTFDVKVVIDHMGDTNTTRIYDRHSPGTFQPGKSAEDSVRHAIEHDRKTYVLRLGELKKKFEW